MLVLDLDGTTLDATGALRQGDRDAARALIQAGVHVTIATGRLWSGAGWVADAFGVDGSVAVMNGTELVDARSGRVTSGAYVDEEGRSLSRRVLAELGLPAFLFRSRSIHFGRDAERHAPYLTIWSRELVPHHDVFDAPHWDDEDVLAVCAVGDHGAIAEVEAALAPKLPPGLGLVSFDTFFGERFLQVMPSRWDKGTALRQLAQDRGLHPSQVVAVGDWINDVPMLQVAGLSLVTAHASAAVRAHAHDALEASRDGGAVAEVARRVWGVA